MTGQLIAAEWAYIDGKFQRDAAVLVEGSQIIDVGAAGDLAAKYPDAERFGGAGYVMLPGLIDSHDHGRALGTVSLGVPDDILEIWIPHLAVLPQLPPRLAAEFEALQLIHAGVTSAAHSHNPASFAAMFDEVPETLAGYRAGGVRVAMHPPFLDQNRLVYDDPEGFIDLLPPHLRQNGLDAITPLMLTADWYFDHMNALFDSAHDTANHWVQIQVSPVGGQWASDALTQRSVEWARARGTRVQMHMLETQYQRVYAFRQWNKGMIAHLDDIGALGDWLTLAHMIWVEDGDADLLAARGACVAHNPSSNLRLRSGVAPIAKFIERGVKVGIGLDGHALDDDQDYLREMRLAFTLGNQPGASSLDLPPLTVLEMATRRGAQITFGDAVSLGALQTGFLADVVLLDWDAVKGDWCPPSFPSEAHLPEFFLRRAESAHVRHVMVNGEWMLRDGKHTQLDEAEVNRAVREAFASQPPPVISELAQYIRQFYARWEGA